MKEFEKIKNKIKDRDSLSTSFYRANDNSLIEMVYDPIKESTALAIYKDEEIDYQDSVLIDGKKLNPYSPTNNLIKNRVVLFPSKAIEYSSEAELIKDIQSFIYRYVDLSPFYLSLSSYYVLFSWVYDCFNELPYLRFIGDTGSGKSRAVETVGSICYKPIFATGSASVSPIFRILDIFRGTLLIDEADYRFSDEKAEMIKILNCGNTPAFPVLRSQGNGGNKKEFEPVSFQVYGPKVFDTRGYFRDQALENRCLTEEMGQRKLREDIPINLPDRFKEEALEIRNKLLMFRFRNYGKKEVNPDLVDKEIEPRLNQIVVPLASIINDEGLLKSLKKSIRNYNKQLIADRGLEEASQVLEVIKSISKPDFEEFGSEVVSVKLVMSCYIEKFGLKTDFGKDVNAKWIGWIIRKNLKLKTKRTEDGYVIPESEKDKLDNLYNKYGLLDKKNEHTEHNEHK